MNKIFIQIASYRDNQLRPTIKDCIEKAKYPENLVFCIAWQHSVEDEWDTLDEYVNDPRFIIIDIDYQQAKGVCWARNLIQHRYKDEEYTLQLDSHHRFIQNWDDECITMFKQLKDKGYAKPLITSYLPSFDPDNDPAERHNEPWMLTFDRFTPQGVIFFMPANINNYKELTEPIACRFYSAHFCFTMGIFCKEVRHDPDFYFHGEEISIAVRAYTWGYDLFSPHKVIAWHEYTRRYRKKHWDDHNDWNIKDKGAYNILKRLVGTDGVEKQNLKGYGLGQVRTLEAYERYAGIQFKNRGTQQYTLDHKLPPNPQIDDPIEYEKSFVQVYKHCIDIHKTCFPYDDYKFIAVIFENATGGTLNREDIQGSEYGKLLDEHDNFYKIWRTFTYVGEKPYKYIVWPFSEKHGWCDRIEDVLHK